MARHAITLPVLTDDERLDPDVRSLRRIVYSLADHDLPITPDVITGLAVIVSRWPTVHDTP